MAKGDDLTGMPLAKVVQAWMKTEDWDDEIVIKDDPVGVRVAATMLIDGQVHRIFIETEEEISRLLIYFYSPYNCPPARMDAMARILNRINQRLNVGRLVCGDDEDSNPVQFKWAIDLDGTQAAQEQVGTMVSMGTSTFSQWGSLLAAVALTKQPFEALWKDELEAQQGSEEEEEGPTEL